MDQQREHIVPALQISHIIPKVQRVNLHLLPAEHSHNIRPQPVKIHIHIYLQRLKGFCLRPVVGKDAVLHCRHHGPRIINMADFPKSIAVIPVSRLGKIHIVPPAQLLYLLFRKPRIFLKIKLIRHGILLKHIQGGVYAVFLDRKDPRHIRQRHIGLIF